MNTPHDQGQPQGEQAGLDPWTIAYISFFVCGLAALVGALLIAHGESVGGAYLGYPLLVGGVLVAITRLHLAFEGKLRRLVTIPTVTGEVGFTLMGLGALASIITGLMMVADRVPGPVGLWVAWALVALGVFLGHRTLKLAFDRAERPSR